MIFLGRVDLRQLIILLLHDLLNELRAGFLHDERCVEVRGRLLALLRLDHEFGPDDEVDAAEILLVWRRLHT